MTDLPMFIYLSLRYEHADDSLFSEGSRDLFEETHIIPVYDCYCTNAPQGKRGDEYCHYYIRNYAATPTSAAAGAFRNKIDPNLKVCCRNGELFYSDSTQKLFVRLEGAIHLYDVSPGNESLGKQKTIIGTLEEMNISM